MSRAQLIEQAKEDIKHGKAGTLAQTRDVYAVPAENYIDEDRWRAEKHKIFRRMPLMLAMTAELRNVDDYKAMDAAGVSVLITRTTTGVKAFVNMCSHRGAQIMDDGKGNATRFSCPYHAWSYDGEGDLVGIYAPNDFGEIDKSLYGLKPLPVLERAGLIWVVTDPTSTLDIELFLSGYDEALSHFGFETWHHHSSRVVAGPNWKVAYDGYMDFYHLPILHRNSFGPDSGNQAMYYNWGPHQRVSRPNASSAALEDLAEADWPIEAITGGVWTIFPHISISGAAGGVAMISQLFPGDTPLSSYTVQNYVMAEEPQDKAAMQEAQARFDLLYYVVEEEDYATGLKLQKNLATGAKDHVLFGRNEAGGQNFHRWVDTILETDDEDLAKLFHTG